MNVCSILMKMIVPEQKNKRIVAYTTSTNRKRLHIESKRLGFKSTSKMILTACNFLVAVLDNGTMAPQIPKDGIWEGWERPKSKLVVEKILKESGQAAVIEELKSAFATGYIFKKYTDEELGIGKLSIL